MIGETGVGGYQVGEEPVDQGDAGNVEGQVETAAEVVV